MSAVIVRHDPRPTEKTIEHAVALVVSLMYNDNCLTSLVGGDKGLMPVLFRSMLRAAILAAGEFYTATDENGNLLGYAMWMPPGQDLFDTPEQRALGLNGFMASLSEAGKDYYKDVYGKEFPAFVNQCLGSARGKTDSWWLHNLFVRQDRQRQGIGRQLIEVVKAKAMQRGQTLACSTTNDQNAIVYTSYGFEHKGVRQMPSPWGDWPFYVFELRMGKA